MKIPYSFFAKQTYHLLQPYHLLAGSRAEGLLTILVNGFVFRIQVDEIFVLQIDGNVDDIRKFIL